VIPSLFNHLVLPNCHPGGTFVGARAVIRAPLFFVQEGETKSPEQPEKVPGRGEKG